MSNCLKVVSGHFENNYFTQFDIEYHQNHLVYHQNHKQLFYNTFSQIYPKYSDQIDSEPFMGNGLKVVSGHFGRLFDIEYHQNHLVSS